MEREGHGNRRKGKERNRHGKRNRGKWKERDIRVRNRETETYKELGTKRGRNREKG